MFDFDKPFHYSIGVANSIYQEVPSQEKMTAIIKKGIEDFFADNKLSVLYKKGEEGFHIYHSTEQDIQVFTNNRGDIEKLGLDMRQPYSEQLFADAYYRHAIFGAPVYVVLWFTDINHATIKIMSRKDYLSEWEMFQRKKNKIDERFRNYCEDNDK